MVENNRKEVKDSLNQTAIIKKINEVIDFSKTIQENVIKDLDGIKAEVGTLKSAVEKINAPSLEKEIAKIEKKVDDTKSQTEKVVEEAKKITEPVAEKKEEVKAEEKKE